MDANEFFLALYDGASGYLSIWRLQGRRSAHYPIDSLPNFGIDLDRDHDWYFGVGLRKRDPGLFARGKAEDVSALPGVWVELDVERGTKFGSKREIEDFLEGFRKRPTIVVDSGGGYHAYWLFEGGALPLRTAGERELAQRRVKGFQAEVRKCAGVGVDSTHDLARVLRVPGTINQKYPAAVRVVYSDGPRWPVEAFEPAAAPEAPESSLAPITGQLARLEDALSAIPAKSHDVWLRVGFVLRAYDEAGFEVWDRWSRSEPNKYPGAAELRRRWSTFPPDPDIGPRWIIRQATEYGWHDPEVALADELVQAMQKRARASVYHPGSDQHAADELAFMAQDRFCFGGGLGWLEWRPPIWRRIAHNQRGTVAAAASSMFARRANDLEDDGREKAAKLLYGLGRRFATSGGDKVVARAEGNPRLSRDESQFDEHASLLATREAVVDLRSGVRLDPDPELYLTARSPVRYDEQAKAPRWRAFIDEVCGGDRAKAQYLQRWAGYALTAETIEQCLLILWGSGANGKSVFLDTLRAVIGKPLAMVTPFDSFLAQRSNTTDDLASMHNARLVLASEAPEGAALDEVTIKRITGGEPVACRFLYGSHFEYVPRYKIVLSTNYIPEIRGSDDGIWRRLRIVEFGERFIGSDADPRLPEKLQAEASGILRWAVEGAKRWYDSGLADPDFVRRAVAAYRQESDPVWGWFTEHIDRGTGNDFEFTRDLFSAFVRWARDHNVDGDRLPTLVHFGRKLSSYGLKHTRRSEGRGFKVRFSGERRH